MRTSYIKGQRVKWFGHVKRKEAIQAKLDQPWIVNQKGTNQGRPKCWRHRRTQSFTYECDLSFFEIIFFKYKGEAINKFKLLLNIKLSIII
jgi:hypothetical protein